MSFVRCHMSCVMCRMSPVTCHMSLTPTATATDPTPANSPTVLSRMLLRQKCTTSPRKKTHWEGQTLCRGRIINLDVGEDQQ